MTYTRLALCAFLCLLITAATAVAAPKSKAATSKTSSAKTPAATPAPTAQPTAVISAPMKKAVIIDFTVEKRGKLKKPFDVTYSERKDLKKGANNAHWAYPIEGPCFGIFMLGTGKEPGRWMMKCRHEWTADGELTPTGRAQEVAGEGHGMLGAKVSFRAQLEDLHPAPQP